MFVINQGLLLPIDMQMEGIAYITVPVVERATVRQNSVWAAGSLPVAGVQREWILIQYPLRLVPMGLETELPSGATNTPKKQSKP